ncbi:MAG: Yip1 family protein [Bacteroidota bacterium]|nr:Yip1 family protein [Bacteroidota bacterium]
MDFRFLSHRVKSIILDPEKTWEAIHYENRPVNFVRGSFFFPLIILVAISAFLGSILFTNTGVSEAYSVLLGIKYFVLLCLVLYGTSFILNEITSYLGLGRNSAFSFKLVVYSSAPFLLCQIVSRLFESFIFVNVLALYGLYIFWTGIVKMLNPPEKKRMLLLVTTTVVFIVLLIGGNWVLTQIMDKIYFTFFS